MATTHKINFQSEDCVELVLQDGQVIHLQLNDIEGDALPQLELWFDQDLVANCWGEGLKPAKQLRGSSHALLVRQICIPIEHVRKYHELLCIRQYDHRNHRP